MKTQAWQFESLGGPENLRLVDQELSEPGPGEALVEVQAIGLNRSDLLFLAGHYISQPPSPSFLGQEAVGEIVALGPPMEGAEEAFEVGDRVALMVGRVDYAGMGTYRRHGIYSQSALLPWPEGLGASEVAGLWVAGLTAAGGLLAGGLEPGKAAGRRVVVTAASSGVGTVALQMASAWGATTVATTTSAGKGQILENLADHVAVVPTAESLEPALRAALGDEGFDVAFDPVGFPYLPGLFQAAATDAQIVSYGIMAFAEVPFDLGTLLRKDLGVHGFTIYRLMRHADRLAVAVEAVRHLAEAGRLRPIVARTFPFEEAPEALTTLARNGHLGKLVVETT